MTELNALKQNFLAISEVVTNKKNANKDIVKGFVGFGATPSILRDPKKNEDWKKTEESLRIQVEKIHDILLEGMKTKENVQELINSAKKAVLTSFYTPTPIVDVITSQLPTLLLKNNINILDPSAGLGVFTNRFANLKSQPKITLVEKDRITSSMLSILEQERANVVRDGYENLSFQNNKQDLIISNIPFGDFKIFDRELPKHLIPISKNIHSYYFTKSIELLNQQGVLAFITSTSIADNKNSAELREHIIKECNLISLVRLPNSTFEGTAVNSDLIVLRKRERALKHISEATLNEQNFIKTELNKFQGIEHTENLYLKNNPHKIIGNKTVSNLHNRKNISYSTNLNINQIAERLSDELKSDINLTKLESNQLSLFSTEDIPVQSRNIEKPKTIIDKFSIEKYSLEIGQSFIVNDILGEIKDGFQFDPSKYSTINTEEYDRIYSYNDLVNSFLELSYSIANIPHTETNQLHQLFVEKYEQFTDKYGNIKENNKDLLITRDISAFYFEEQINNRIERSDLLKKPQSLMQFINNQAEKPLEKELTLEDALKKSLNIKGEVDIDYMALLLDQEKIDVMSEALSQGLIFIDPKVNQLNNDFEYEPIKNSTFKFSTKDQFIAGPTRFKLIEYKQNNFQWSLATPDIINNSIDLLEKNNINELSLEEIEPQLGENWIPQEYFEEFAQKEFETDVKIKRLEHNSEYVVQHKHYSRKNDQEYAIKLIGGKAIRGTKLFEIALHGVIPKFEYKEKIGDSTVVKLDRDAMILAAEKITTIKANWQQFIITNPHIKRRLENIYNNTQNINKERVYDGEHMSFPGLKHYKPYLHQKNAAWQVVSQNGGLIDHAVGAGKTLVIASTAMELKRLGLAKKILIICLPANTKAIYDDFKKAYPDANVLLPSNTDTTPKGRTSFFQKIAENDYDAIIMNHDQFKLIPQSREIQHKIIKEELNNIMLDFEAEKEASQTNSGRTKLKGLERKIENYQVKILELENSIRRDPNLLTFDKMKIDHLFVDESHEFKNLPFSTRFSEISGLGNPSGSQKAFNLLMAVRTIQNLHNADKGITFLSGTTISNSLVEMYLIQKYLNPRKLIEKNMPNFDSWARTYAMLSRDFELTVTNEIKQKDRFRFFLKVPELARDYRYFSNIVTDQNLEVDKPSLNTILIDIPISPLQDYYMKNLLNAVHAEDFSFFNKDLTKEQMQAKMLIATTLATKISLDLRLIDPAADLYDGSKILTVSKNIIKHFNQSTSYLGTQFVFLDTSTPTSINAKDFNLYQSLKDHLVEAGISEKEIAFIHDYKTDRKKKELFEKVNNGEIRIVVGSTKKMGVGVNMQERCIAMHHIDIPWRPMDFTQRNGRGARQGNLMAKIHTNNVVQNYIYATEGTLDAYKYYLVDLKDKFINQIKSQEIKNRTIDEGDIGENGEMSAAAFIAKLSGKEELLEKNKIDKKIADIEIKKSLLLKEFNQISNNINYAQKSLPKAKELLSIYEIDYQNSKDLFSTNQESKIQYTLKTLDKEITENEKLKEHFQKELNQAIFSRTNYTKIGEIGKFEIILSKLEIDGDSLYSIHSESKETQQKYYYGKGVVSPLNRKAYRQPYDGLKLIEDKVSQQKRGITTLEENLKFDKASLSKIDISKYDKELFELKEASNKIESMIYEQEQAKKTNKEENSQKKPIEIKR